MQTELPFPPSAQRFFRISEISQLLEVPASTIRHWEHEFGLDTHKPALSKQRLYDLSDLDTLRKIRHLLYERKYTIAGAKDFLLSARSTAPAKPAASQKGVLQEMLNKLDHLLDILP